MIAGGMGRKKNKLLHIWLNLFLVCINWNWSLLRLKESKHFFKYKLIYKLSFIYVRNETLTSRAINSDTRTCVTLKKYYLTSTALKSDIFNINLEYSSIEKKNNQLYFFVNAENNLLTHTAIKCAVIKCSTRSIGIL